jgi:hypothetical protein
MEDGCVLCLFKIAEFKISLKKVNSAVSPKITQFSCGFTIAAVIN